MQIISSYLNQNAVFPSNKKVIILESDIYKFDKEY